MLRIWRDCCIENSMTGTAEKSPRQKTDTRESLIRAAEKLFSEQGIEAVAMRQIAAAAGQKNNYATQYHFGSKDELVRAIFESRLEAIEVRRQEMLRDLELEGQLEDMRGVVAMMLRPAAERLLTHRGEHFYLRFVSALSRTMSPDFFEGGRDIAPAYARGIDLINDILSDMPKRVRHQRIDWCLSNATLQLGRLERDVAELGFAKRAAIVGLTTENLIDFCVAGLEAPVSPDVQDMLKG